MNRCKGCGIYTEDTICPDCIEEGCRLDIDNDVEWLNENGKLHRFNGPAVELANGDKFWYKEGQLHRLDGPALIYADGTKRWHIEGKEYTEEEFNDLVSKKPSYSLTLFM